MPLKPNSKRRSKTATRAWKTRSSLEQAKPRPVRPGTKPVPAVAKFPQTQLGSRLKHARLTKGMSLRQVADEVGCTESFLSKVENSRVNPSLKMMHRIVAVLEINAAALFTDEEPSQGPVVIMRNGSRAKIRVDP